VKRVAALILGGVIACSARSSSIKAPAPEHFTTRSKPEQIVDAATKELTIAGFQIVNADRPRGYVVARIEPDRARNLIRCASADDSAKVSATSLELTVQTEQKSDIFAVWIGAVINAHRAPVGCVSTGELESRVARAIRAS
jgi:hypothetical protein